jgi:hypothetical protein
MDRQDRYGTSGMVAALLGVLCWMIGAGTLAGLIIGPLSPLEIIAAQFLRVAGFWLAIAGTVTMIAWLAACARYAIRYRLGLRRIARNWDGIDPTGINKRMGLASYRREYYRNSNR